jgi:hypothetical protein
MQPNNHGVRYNYGKLNVAYRNSREGLAAFIDFADDKRYALWNYFLEKIIKTFANNQLDQYPDYRETLINVVMICQHPYMGDLVKQLYGIRSENEASQVQQIKIPIKVYETANQRLQSFIKSFNQYYASINFNSITEKFATDQKRVETLTAILSMVNDKLLVMTMAMNYLALSIAEENKLPSEFYRSINDIETMDRFVLAMFNSNFSSIDIKNYIYAAAKSEMIGEGSHRDPIWGQTRITFFPTKSPDRVYKIGYNKAGANANMQELKIYKMCIEASRKNGVEFPLAKSISITIHNIVEEMQRIDQGHYEPTSEDAQEVCDLLNDNAEKCDMPIEFSDIHPGNIMKDKNSGKLLCIDYGAIGFKF